VVLSRTDVGIACHTQCDSVRRLFLIIRRLRVRSKNPEYVMRNSARTWVTQKRNDWINVAERKSDELHTINVRCSRGHKTQTNKVTCLFVVSLLLSPFYRASQFSFCGSKRCHVFQYQCYLEALQPVSEIIISFACCGVLLMSRPSWGDLMACGRVSNRERRGEWFLIFKSFVRVRVRKDPAAIRV